MSASIRGRARETFLSKNLVACGRRWSQKRETRAGVAKPREEAREQVRKQARTRDIDIDVDTDII